MCKELEQICFRLAHIINWYFISLLHLLYYYWISNLHWVAEVMDCRDDCFLISLFYSFSIFFFSCSISIPNYSFSSWHWAMLVLASAVSLNASSIDDFNSANSIDFLAISFIRSVMMTFYYAISSRSSLYCDLGILIFSFLRFLLLNFLLSERPKHTKTSFPPFLSI